MDRVTMPNPVNRTSSFKMRRVRHEDKMLRSTREDKMLRSTREDKKPEKLAQDAFKTRSAYRAAISAGLTTRDLERYEPHDAVDGFTVEEVRAIIKELKA